MTRSSLGSLLYGSMIGPEDLSLIHNKFLPEPGSDAIVLATVFEYVTATYDQEMIPRLLAAIPEHEQAETLIPAVFGVPLADFAQGWRAFLMERYALEQ